MHETSMDKLCYRSPFRDWPPLGKLILSLVLILATLLANSPPVPLLVLAIGTVLFSLSSRLYLPKIFLFAYFDTLLIIFVGALLISLITAGTAIWSGSFGPITLTLTTQGINLGTLVFLRALADLSVLLFFASSTSIPHFFIALRQVGLPASLSELAVLVYRYSFLLADQVDLMITAAQCRLGFHSLRSSIHTISTIVACVFGRSMDLAERAQYALYCRNFQGNFPLLNTPAKLTLKWVLVPAAILILMIFLASQTRTLLLI